MKMEFKSLKDCSAEDEMGRSFHPPEGRTQVSVYKLQKRKDEQSFLYSANTDGGKPVT